MKKILFICTGNTCRSAMAEGFLNSYIRSDEELSSQYIAASAGLATFKGDSASQNAVEVMKSDWNIDIAGHRSSSIVLYELENAFLILTMTKKHKDTLLALVPDMRDKIYTLKEYVSGESANNDLGQNFIDISDPFGGSISTYRQCSHDIRQAVLKLVEILKKN